MDINIEYLTPVLVIFSIKNGFDTKTGMEGNTSYDHVKIQYDGLCTWLPPDIIMSS